jgi:dihydrofolate reductase
MRPLLLDLTTSLDGFIADGDGGIDWILPPPDDAHDWPADHLALMDTVDALVMGRLTYELSLRMSGGTDVFDGKSVYVITSRSDFPAQEGVEFVHRDPVGFVGELKRGSGGTIWMYVGGRLATALSAAGLIDDYLIVIQPVLLGGCIPLWRDGSARQRLDLDYCREWPGGLVELRYRPACEQAHRADAVR